jgi:hypothetical protein
MMSEELRLILRLPALVLGACLAFASSSHAEPVISELMASNVVTLADEDGAYSDWLEIHNPDPTPVSLAGWYLTDSASNKTKWRFPEVTIPGGGFIVVFASNKDRRVPGAPLHTNFALSAGGEYLGLIKSDGVTVAHEYAPTFPALKDDVAYGLPMPASGPGVAPALLSQATPGAANLATPAIIVTETVSFSRDSGPFRNSFALELAGAAGGQKIRYVISRGLAAGAAAVSADSPVYTAPLVIDSSAVVTAAVFSEDGTARGPVARAHYGKINVPGFTSQLPVLVIDSLGTGPLAKDGIDHASWMYVYGARGTPAPTFGNSPELISSLTASVRGSSSAEFPKKGLNIKFTSETGGKKPTAILDLPAYEKWALVAPWSFDQNYINNSVGYALSNAIGRWAPRTRLAEVFLNTQGDDIDQSDYAGIYVITDRIEIAKGRVELSTLSASDLSGDALTGGYLLKIDAPDADEIAWVTQRGVPADPVSQIVLVAPKADDVAPAQLTFIQTYVQRMENALHNDRASGWAQRTYLDYIDRASWVDHHILNIFFANPDAFVRSAYFHKNRGGKIAAGPIWDLDRALGAYWDERSFRWDVWSGYGAPDAWRVGWWGVLAEDPEFVQAWVDRWQALRRNEFSSASLRTLVDGFAAQVGSDAAQRDAARWPDNASPYGSYAAQIEHLRNWIVNRAGWIDAQFVAAPAVELSGGSLIFIAPAKAELIYTLDGSDPRSLGGDIAPGALRSSTPLTLPANANIHVRAYRADLRGVFPGSPWSSAVGGESSSPLTPTARLVNISSRAIVGSGDNALIAGVVVADTESKRYLSRAIGPGLAAFGASGLVGDPELSIFTAEGSELFRNNGWENGPDAAQMPAFARRVGAFPLASGSSDSALATPLTGGAYTVQIATPSGQSGVGLAELYELDGNGRTVNLSTRAYVHTGDGVLIGGFVVSGPAYKRMLVRAVGPTLSAFGLENALADPVLTVYRGSEVVATNDRWESAENAMAAAAASTRAGAFALGAGSQDAALLITLAPGAYTLEVKGKGGAEGIALLEIYEVP